MRRDRIVARPVASRTILILGAAVHFIACSPLYGRRGFPEVDPFWLAMVWLWVPFVIISAVFAPLDRRRWKSLAVYALATGFVLSYSTVMLIPNHRTPIDAAIEVIVFGPIMFVGICVVEIVSRLLLGRLRQFIPAERRCEECGYNLTGLIEPRCPECGVSFDPVLLDPEYTPRVTRPAFRWTTCLIVLVGVGALAFPSVYRSRAFRSRWTSGQRWAEQDWASGSPIWFVTEEELTALPDPDVVFNLEHQVDPLSGFEIRRMWRDWEHQWLERGYRSIIERKLRESGRKPPNLIRPTTATAPI